VSTFIELGDLGFPEAAHDGWLFNNLVDWYSLTDDKNDDDEKSQGHGTFETEESWRSAAAISFTAAFLGKTHADVLAAAERLTAIGATRRVRMAVTDDLRTTFRTVRVKASPVPATHGKPQAEFDIDVIAADPRRYGLTETDHTELPKPGTGIVFPIVFPIDLGKPADEGRITLNNLGTAPTAPRFTVTGGFTNITLTEVGSGRRLTLDRSVPAGSSVTFDAHTRRVLLDGQTDISSTFLTSREWWTVAPGSTSIVQFTGTGAIGTPELFGEINPAWW